MALFEYRFPELGEGIHEGEIVKLHIKPGDMITDEDLIMDVQNDKAVVEVPCPVDGKIVDVKVKDGQVCKVGDLVATIEVEGELPEQSGHSHSEGPESTGTGAAAKASSAPGTEAPTSVDQVKANVGEAVVENVKDAKLSTTAAGKDDGSGSGEAGSKAAAANRVILATPSVRKLAREKGIAIGEVTATGKNGNITREDVEAFAAGGEVSKAAAVDATAIAATAETDGAKTEVAETTGKTASSAPAAGDRPEERIPFKGIRKMIANAMVKSVYTAPHVTLMDEVDVSALVALRTRVKPIAEKKGVKLTYLPFIVKALVAGVRQFPVLNAMIDEDKNEIVLKKYYNIGIATDTDNGLIVPVITDADRKNVWMIADAIKDLAVRGRDGKLAAHEMRGSTISITNIGSAGGMFFTPVINFPEVAILGTGRITEKPVVKDGQIVAAHVMALSLSFDHRIIDGATAQHFLNYVKQLLADPELLVMEV